MIPRIIFICVIATQLFSSCRAQNKVMDQKYQVVNVESYQLELVPIQTSDPETLRWDVFLKAIDGGLKHLDTITIAPRSGIQFSELNGNPLEAVSLAGAYLENDTLYVMYVIDRLGNLRVYPLSGGQHDRKIIHPYELVGVGSFMNRGAVYLNAEFKLLSKQYVAMNLIGSIGYGDGYWPPRVYDKVDRKQYHLVEGDGHRKIADNTIDGLSKIPLRQLGELVLIDMPELFKLPPPTQSYQLLGFIDQSQSGQERNMGKAYFFYGTSSDDRVQITLCVDFFRKTWDSGPYKFEVVTGVDGNF